MNIEQFIRSMKWYYFVPAGVLFLLLGVGAIAAGDVTAAIGTGVAFIINAFFAWGVWDMNR